MKIRFTSPKISDVDLSYLRLPEVHHNVFNSSGEGGGAGSLTSCTWTRFDAVRIQSVLKQSKLLLLNVHLDALGKVTEILRFEFIYSR